MLCLTSSGAPIGDVIVVFSTHSISKKSHETTRPNSETLNIIVLWFKNWAGGFFYPQTTISSEKVNNQRTNWSYKCEIAGCTAVVEFRFGLGLSLT